MRSSLLLFAGLGVWLGYARLFCILFRSAFPSTRTAYLTGQSALAILMYLENSYCLYWAWLLRQISGYEANNVY